jgi:hypothetical protein
MFNYWYIYWNNGVKMNKNVILQKCWVWNDSVTEFVKSKINGYSLNVCAGKNPLCDVNIDLDPQADKVKKGDMRLLDFDSNTFDTVISDPPWKISYYERMRPFFECVRVCKIGGVIVYNATWIPSSTDVELIETYVRQDNVFSNTSVISVFRKVRENKEYSDKISKERVNV